MEIPVDTENIVYQTFGELAHIRDVVRDGYWQYVRIQHSMDSFKWLAKSKENEKCTEYRLYKIHDNWSKILDESKCDVEIVKETKE